MIVYKITNTVNGKIYVGQTIHSLATRWHYHVKSSVKGSTCALHSAIRKYGKEAFKVEKLTIADSLEDLNQKEALYIIQLNTLVPTGYNLTSGGANGEMSKETRSKIQEAALNRTHSKETRQKMSETHTKSACRRGHPFNSENTYVNPNTGKRQCWVCRYTDKGLQMPRRLRRL